MVVSGINDIQIVISGSCRLLLGTTKTEHKSEERYISVRWLGLGHPCRETPHARLDASNTSNLEQHHGACIGGVGGVMVWVWWRSHKWDKKDRGVGRIPIEEFVSVRFRNYHVLFMFYRVSKNIT